MSRHWDLWRLLALQLRDDHLPRSNGRYAEEATHQNLRLMMDKKLVRTGPRYADGFFKKNDDSTIRLSLNGVFDLEGIKHFELTDDGYDFAEFVDIPESDWRTIMKKIEDGPQTLAALMSELKKYATAKAKSLTAASQPKKAAPSKAARPKPGVA